MVFSITSLLGAAAGLLQGNGPSSNLSFTSTPDVWSFVSTIAPSGPLLVESHGDPFGETEVLVTRRIADAVAATFTEPWLTFTDDPARAGSKDLRLIWLLAPQAGFNADLVCGGELPSAAPRSRVMEVRAVLCHRGRALSAVHGWVRWPETSDDPKWRRLIAQMARQLLTGRG